MISTGKKMSSPWIFIVLSVVLIVIAASLWAFFSNRDKQQNKTYSGAKLVEHREYNTLGREIT